MQDTFEKSQNYLNLVRVSNRVVLGLTRYLTTGEKGSDLPTLCSEVIELAEAGRKWSPRLTSQQGSASLIGDPGALRVFHLAAGKQSEKITHFWKRLRQDAICVRNARTPGNKGRQCADRLRQAFDDIGELSMFYASETRVHARIAEPGKWLLNC